MVAKLLQQNRIFCILYRKSFSFDKGYLALKLTLKFYWSVLRNLNWVSYIWDTGEV